MLNSLLCNKLTDVDLSKFLPSNSGTTGNLVWPLNINGSEADMGLNNYLLDRYRRFCYHISDLAQSRSEYFILNNTVYAVDSIKTTD